MRPFRSARLLVIPALVLPVVLSTVALSGTAWARAPRPLSADSCQGRREVPGLSATAPSPPSPAGDSTATSTPFPTHAGFFSVVVTWNPVGEAHRGGPAGTTTFHYSATQLVGHKNKCGTSSTEWSLAGTVLSNTVSPKVKGKLKVFACVSKSGTLSQKKPVKL